MSRTRGSGRAISTIGAWARGLPRPASPPRCGAAGCCLAGCRCGGEATACCPPTSPSSAESGKPLLLLSGGSGTRGAGATGGGAGADGSGGCGCCVSCRQAGAACQITTMPGSAEGRAGAWGNSRRERSFTWVAGRSGCRAPLRLVLGCAAHVTGTGGRRHPAATGRIAQRPSSGLGGTAAASNG